MGIEYYYANDLNKLYNGAVDGADEKKRSEMQDCLDRLEEHILSMDHWKDTALQLAKNNGESSADADRLATEYESVLREIGGVWWEDPFEKSPALIAHKIRMEKK